MRRALYWYLPLAVALFACVVFAAGFSSFLRGDIGTPVGITTAPIHVAPPSTTIVPLILGDSLARGTGDQSGLGIGGRLVQDLVNAHRSVRPAVNLAVNGARTGDLLQELQSRNVQTLIGESNVIVVSIGGNDLWGTTDLRNGLHFDPEKVMDAVLDRVTTVIKDVRAANPTARIFLIGLYNPLATAPGGRRLTPLVNRWNAKLLEQFAADPNLTVVPTSDLFSHRDRLAFDRFHPDDEGYALIAQRIAESL